MALDFNLLVGGEAGQGVQSVGLILSKAIARGGLHVFADQDYESRVRGGHNFFRIRVSDTEVLAASEELDIMIALNRETVDIHKSEMKEVGIIIFDGEQIMLDARDKKFFSAPLSRLAEEKAGNKIMANTVAVGVALGLVGYDFHILESVLKKEFEHQGEKIVEGNLAAAGAGFSFSTEENRISFKPQLHPLDKSPERMLINGNEALALGALAGGCKFISGYPMTPATLILEYFADKGREYNAVAVHVEDEISAINMAIGAAYTGVRAMTATSGGGFSLMAEGLSLAGMTETSVVIVLGQRPGPATGMPTRTEQGDLELALHAGHGEFPRAILAPPDAENAFSAIIKAFNLAEKYQTPVIVLSDHHLVTSYTTINRFELKKVYIDRGELLSDKEAESTIDYKRHVLTDSGISPRAFPSQGKALVVTDSDEHDESGHMIEDAETRVQQNLKRMRKIIGLKKEISPPELNRMLDAKLTLIGWGSTRGAIREAAILLKDKGIAADTIHFCEIYPFPVEEFTSLLEGNTRTIVIESNATAQFSHLIRRETGINIKDTVLRFDGRPITANYIIERIKEAGR
ncbi:2-oxoacid:acceptor oxidoreductase subunit alpha [Chloroflexota bacterium]